MYTNIYRSPDAHASASAKAPRRASRSIRAPALIPYPETTIRTTTVILSAPSVPSCYLLASRTKPPLQTSTLKPKELENLRPQARCEIPLPLTLRTTLRDAVQSKHPKGRFASIQNAPFTRQKLDRRAPVRTPSRKRSVRQLQHVPHTMYKLASSPSVQISCLPCTCVDTPRRSNRNTAFIVAHRCNNVPTAPP